MPEINPQQMTFGGGVNAVVPPHVIGEDEVQTATNIDFSLERGAATVRRGSTNVATPDATNTGKVWLIYKHHNDPTGGLSTTPTYVQVGSNIYRGVSGTYTQIGASGVFNETTGIASFRQYTYIPSTNGTQGIKDDGTSALEWPGQAPGGALSVTASTLTGVSVATAFSVAEGTLVGTATDTITASQDSTTFRIQFSATPVSTNLNTNGTLTIGDYGIDSLKIKCNDPAKVVRISRDYSIGDTSFTNYWHTEMDVNLYEFIDMDVFGYTGDNAQPDPDVLIDSELNVGTSTDTSIDLLTRQEMLSDARIRTRSPKTRISAAANIFNVWAVPRTKFELININPTPAGWTNIGAVRVVIDLDGPAEVAICDWKIDGCQGYPISDAEVGVAYWETFATLESNTLVLAESAPSPSSTRLKCQNVRTVVVSTNTATGTSHGYTHRIFYRQGGYLADGYAVGTTSYATATFTDSVADMAALSSNIRLERNLLSRSTFSQNITAEAGPHYDRLFVGYENKIRWSLPGRPDCFPRTSWATVSHVGDNVKSIISWAPSLVVVNRDSVYEMHGDLFESRDANYVLQRTGSRRGTKAAKVAIKTPFGIPLIDYDGLSMYVPGQGVDVPLTWAMEKMADTFKGHGASDPATLKGSRIPALLGGAVLNSVAAWADDKLYLGLPCGGATVNPNTLFVLDFRTQQVWWYTYPFEFNSLYWDFVNNTLLCGTSDGKIMQLETGRVDYGSNGTATNITWSLRSRAWTTPNDAVLENVSVEHQNGIQTIVKSVYDNTATATLGTLTNTAKDWLAPPMLGTTVNNVVFDFSGTQTASKLQTLYNIQWDALLEPKRVEYWRTEHDINNHDGEKSWDVHFADMEIIGTGTVAGTVYVDNTAIMTVTLSGSSNGRQIHPNSFPAHTYGDVAYTVYRAQSGILFKHWQTTFDARNEPPRVSVWRTDVESLEENLCDAMDLDISPNGTVVSTVFVDNTAVGTYTSVGSDREQSFTHALPNASSTHTAPHGLYGRTLYAIHTGTNFKHYKTWFHLRPEPDRWTNFVSKRRSGNEMFFDTFECDVDPLGGTLYATAVIDNTAVATYTITGNGRKSYPFAIPEDKYGRTYYAAYTGSGTGRFKFYEDWFEGTPEPDRVNLVQAGPYMYPSNQNLRTWVVDMNPLGTTTGVLYIDHVAASTATFTGTNRTTFNIGLDVDTSIALRTAAYEVDVVYTAVGAGAVMKHYNTGFETTAKPFGKKTWSITYTKVGGATQLDLARFWSYDIEASTSGTATFTNIWDIDGVAFSTETFTLTGRHWQDRRAFPPGGRGYLFQQRLLSDTDIMVWKSNLDTLRVGIKGLTRVTTPGSPPSPTEPAVRHQGR